jgi:hypothetical protein
MGASGLFRTGAYLAALLLFSAIPCFARPFLVSDPYPKGQNQPTQFDLVCGNLKFSCPPETLRNGGKRLKLDLSTLPDGEITLKIKAVKEPLGYKSESVSVHLVKKGQDVTLHSVVMDLPPARAPESPQVIPEKQKIPPSRTYPGHLRSG